MPNLERYKSPWPFPRFIYIRRGGEPVQVLAQGFKFNADNTLKGVVAKVGEVSTFLPIKTFFSTEQEARDSLTNTPVKDVFDEPALM